MVSLARKILVTAALALAVVAHPNSAHAQAGGCSVTQTPFCDGCTGDRHVSMNAGNVCIMRAVPTSNITLISRTVVVRPKTGSVGQDGVAVRAYRPKPGFAGTDYFEDRIVFEESGRRKSMIVRNHVTIR